MRVERRSSSGSGHSAANALLELAQLAEIDPRTSFLWATRSTDLARIYSGGDADQLPARGELGADVRALVDSGRVKLVTGFAAVAIYEKNGGVIVEGETADGLHRIGPVDRIIAATGQRPDLSLTRELRLDLDPWLESAKALGPLIDPNVHSCGSVPPHGHRELAHPEPGFYTVGIKSYGRAPTFLLLTGYEQVRSVAAAIAGDMAAADDVRLVLPETGVCSTRPVVVASDSAGMLRRPRAGKSRCVLRRRRGGKGRRKGRLRMRALREQLCPARPFGSRRRLASRALIISALGVTQIFAWGTTYYLPAVLAAPIVADTGWSLAWVVGGLSLGLLMAGLVSPWVGRAIALRGGRPVLAVSAGLLAAGLPLWRWRTPCRLFSAPGLVVGLGMGAGLYDPAFATLGRLYGHGGRSAITTLTLFGGFASTVCWPLSAFLDAHLGWRGACLVYAGFQLAVALPVYLFVLPRESPRPRASGGLAGIRERPRRHRAVFEEARFSCWPRPSRLSSVISTALSVHLLTVLQAKGLTLAAAVGLGALVGPSQVAARTVEMVIARYHHPIWTKVASTSLVATGLAALWFGAPIIPLALALYGAGIGLESIARGTLPLAIFGPERYPVIMGRIAMPSLIAQAAAPSIGTALIEMGGVDGAMGVFVRLGRRQCGSRSGLVSDAAVFVSIALTARKTDPLSGRKPQKPSIPKIAHRVILFEQAATDRFGRFFPFALCRAMTLFARSSHPPIGF